MPTAPEPLAADHALEKFDCSVATLDKWLQRSAMASQANGRARTYVICDAGQVLGYYALALKAVVTVAPARAHGSLLAPAPVVMLARLAIARSHQKRGLGRSLFRDAARRVIQAAEATGIRAMLVRFLSEEAREFYLRVGLEASLLDPMTLMMTVADLRVAQRSEGAGCG